MRNVRNGHVGDLYCKISVETPVNLTNRQQELLREFDELTREGGAKHNPRERSWIDKIKNFLG